MVSTCSSIIGHFNGRGGPPVQYEVHCPIQHVQGYSRSHWAPPLGDYLLSIAPAAARATGKNKHTYKAGCFDGHCNAPTTRIAWWRRSKSSLEASTGCRHRASIMSDNIKGTWLRQVFFMFFIVKIVEKGHGLTLRPLFLIRVWHIKQHGGRDDSILSAKLIRIAPENSSF